MTRRQEYMLHKLKARLGPTVLQKAPPNTVTSFRELPKVQLPKPLITEMGGLFKARWPGKRDCCYGATREEAMERLRNGRLKSFE